MTSKPPSGRIKNKKLLVVPLFSPLKSYTRAGEGEAQEVPSSRSVEMKMSPSYQLQTISPPFVTCAAAHQLRLSPGAARTTYQVIESNFPLTQSTLSACPLHTNPLLPSAPPAAGSRTVKLLLFQIPRMMSSGSRTRESWRQPSSTSPHFNKNRRENEQVRALLAELLSWCVLIKTKVLRRKRERESGAAASSLIPCGNV